MCAASSMGVDACLVCLDRYFSWWESCQAHSVFWPCYDRSDLWEGTFFCSCLLRPHPPPTDRPLSFRCWDLPPLLGQKSMVQGPCSPGSASQVSGSNSSPPIWLGGVLLLTYLGDSPQDKEAFWVSRNIEEHAISIDWHRINVPTVKKSVLLAIHSKESNQYSESSSKWRPISLLTTFCPFQHLIMT